MIRKKKKFVNKDLIIDVLMLCVSGHIFHIEKSAIFLVVVKSDFVSPSIADVSDMRVLGWILNCCLTVVVSISLYVFELWSVSVVEKEIFRLDAS